MHNVNVHTLKISEKCRKVIIARIDKKTMPSHDILHADFHCQQFSIFGQKKGEFEYLKLDGYTLLENHKQQPSSAFFLTGAL